MPPGLIRVTRKFIVRRVANDVLNWIFPTKDNLCVVCGRPVVQPFTRGDTTSGTSFGMCLFCLQDVRTCQMNADRNRLSIPGTQRTLQVCSCLPYDHFIRTLIRSWKYDGVIELSHVFADILMSAWGVELSKGRPVVIPVPSSLDRTRKRGYDHVGILAKQFATHNQLPLKHALLRLQRKDEFTGSQTSKGRSDRYRDLDGAYAFNRHVSVAGKTVLLIDDIVTTGSTLVHCASTLYDAGAREIVSLVIARVL